MPMEITLVSPDSDLTAVVQVLNVSHGTVAKDFGFTKDTNPTNNAFVEEPALRIELLKGIELYALHQDGKMAGCIAIEKSGKEADTFYIEKVSVIPECRKKGLGVTLMDFAVSRIKEAGGKIASIALIDSHAILKRWYASQGFTETGTKDYDYLPFRVCFMSKRLN